MAASEPIDPRVLLAISRWPDDAPRGAVSTFCSEHGISQKVFYELRKRAVLDGPAAVLEPRTRRPGSSPTKLSEEVRAQAIQVRAALESSGLDHGPISVHDKMYAMGLDPVPSVASLARIFREAGVARLEPRKRPRSAWRRFVDPAPNACWQLGAAEYVLIGGRTCVIFQLIDDHSRYAVSRSRVATRGRGDHRQALQADHPGQERAIPPNPVPLPRPAATGQHAGRAASPGRRVRPHLQHRASPPGTTGPGDPADGLGSDREG